MSRVLEQTISFLFLFFTLVTVSVAVLVLLVLVSEGIKFQPPKLATFRQVRLM